MQVTNYAVNATGLKGIKEFLQANHKTFLNQEPMKSELNAWAADAESSLGNGNPAMIEVGHVNSITGCPVTYTVSSDGIDTETVEIEE